MQAFIDKDHPQHNRYNTVAKTVRNTIQDEGMGALLKGVGPRAFRITCALLITSVVVPSCCWKILMRHLCTAY